MDALVLVGLAAVWSVVIMVGLGVPSRGRVRALDAGIGVANELGAAAEGARRTVVGRDELRRHKTLAAAAGAVPVGLVGFVLPVGLLGMGDDPNASIPWYHLVVGIVGAASLVGVVVHRYRTSEVMVADTVVVARNPWRTIAIDTLDAPMWRERRHGMARCVEFVGTDFVRAQTVVALPPELVDRLGLELIDMDEAVAAAGGRRRRRVPFDR